MNAILDTVASNLDAELRRLVFPESETPVYRFEIVPNAPDADGSHAPLALTWTPRESFVLGRHRDPTAIIELRQEALEGLFSGQHMASDLLKRQLVRVGGIWNDVFALKFLWGSDEDVAEGNAARGKEAMSTAAKKAVVREWKRTIGSSASTERIRDMADRWAEHRTTRCRLDMWTTVDIADLDHRPWHDPRELSLHARFSDAWTEIHREARQFLERTVKAPHYGVDPSKPDAPSKERPYGWRHWKLIEYFEPKPARREPFPHTSRVIDEIASQYTVVHAGFLLLEPDVTISPHSDGANWCLSHHFGVIVPSKCHQTAAGERRYHRERESMLFEHAFVHSAANESDEVRIVLNVVLANPALNEAECAAIRKLANMVPKGQIVFAT